MHRRRFLGAASIAALAGCIGVLDDGTPTPTPEPPDQDFDGVPDSEDDYPEDALRSKQVILIEDYVELQPDDYRSHRLRLDGETFILEWDVIVEGGPGIDVLLVDRENFVKYTNGEEITHLSGYSQLNIGSGIKESPISGGNYVLILDYTNYATDFGMSSVNVDYTIEVAEVP